MNKYNKLNNLKMKYCKLNPKIVMINFKIKILHKIKIQINMRINFILIRIY